MAGEHPDWRAVHDELAARGLDSLCATELALLGESLFWLDRPDESIAVLGRTFTAHVADGDHHGAAMAAWQLYYDHELVGEDALANGWLERARRHAAEVEGSVAAGFLAVAECDHRAARGALDEALGHAEVAVRTATATGDPDLMAMALQAKGRVLVSTGRFDEGIAALDEAMVAVVNGELAPLFTGWVYCNALSTCHDIGDVHRAMQWSDAASRWCDDLHDGRLYPGICRVHVVELHSLMGAWDAAAAEAAKACEELTSHDPRYAGEAHYLIGELHRLTGELDLAEDAFTRAHQLGRLPQPGLARVRLAQGRVDAAVNGLRLALDPAPPVPLRHAELLVACVEVHLSVGNVEEALVARDEVGRIAAGTSSDYIAALARLIEASVLGATGDPAGACRGAREAIEQFRRLGMSYHEAQARTELGAAAKVVGEHDTATIELELARDTFERLGAEPDARRVRALLGEPTSPLSSRETEVLRLVARGATNKDVAATLVVSEHTVARHLSNIYTKLGVSSRSAATALALERSLI